MARIRSIKPEMRRSLTVCSWPIPVRWTFAGLLGYLDDLGRGIDDTRLIKAELYPLDDDITPRKVDSHLTTITAHGPLCRYEVDGRRFMHITSWSEHQRVNRPTPSRIPPCPIHEDSPMDHELLTESSVNPPGSSSEGSLPRAQARAPAEQGAGSREGSREVVADLVSHSPDVPRAGPDDDRLDLDKIQNTLACDPDWARRVASEVLARGNGHIGNPTRYVLAAITQEPDRYRPTKGPPALRDLCRHGLPTTRCDECGMPAA